MDDPTQTAPSLAGACLCRAVRYEVNVSPVMTGICYCTSCRKLSGAGHAFHALFPEAAVKVEGDVRDYRWMADSGHQVTTSFCPICGSPLFGRSSGMPGTLTLRVASLDDPAAIEPQMAIYADRLLPWDHLDPALTAFPAMPPMEKPA